MRSDKPLAETGMGRVQLQVREPLKLKPILNRSIAGLVWPHLLKQTWNASFPIACALGALQDLLLREGQQGAGTGKTRKRQWHKSPRKQ